MAKNKDSKTVNRTGLFEMDKMTVTAEDKNGIYIFDLKSLLQDFDGNNISITVASDFEPSHQVEE
ncbi:YonK family protein [Paenibacillus tianjinensis]|uniref:YonK family protein n=1 Tax=Paenibacillus tianjinensis TaxID=2810347 RepID=A0ABX7L6A1_9BACL|nr:YonK family protein [Paenibacillus tianjinensis]QSF43524.1 YonK family protein [Paenibacillus tianjinensis]